MSLDVKGTLKDDEVSLNQAAPVQNTWYLIIDARNIFVYLLDVAIITTGETLDVRLTIDGTVYTLTGLAATAGTVYRTYFTHNDTGRTLASAAAGTQLLMGTYQGLWARQFKAEIRKTTVAGTGNLRASLAKAAQ